MNPRQSGLPRGESDVDKLAHFQSGAPSARADGPDDVAPRVDLPTAIGVDRARLSFRRAQRAGTAQMKAHAGYGWMKRERDQSLPIFAPMCASSAGAVCSAVTDYGENDACLTA